jgi:beta-phosphoglucomutase-like phosphatase (HAD superfamily)
MQPVDAILFEPVGCLAEFPVEPFHEIAARVFGRKSKLSRSASRTYWHVLNLMEDMRGEFDPAGVEALELEAAAQATIYEDVPPAFAELKALGVELILASSLSSKAVARFLEKCPGFSAAWSRDNSGAVKTAPLKAAIHAASCAPGRTLFLTDTAEGIKTARSAGIHPILMMNDPDEAKRLTQQNPAGGIVSLLELPDFVRLLTAQASKSGP